MSERMSREDVEALLAKATPGEWRTTGVFKNYVRENSQYQLFVAEKNALGTLSEMVPAERIVVVRP